MIRVVSTNIGEKKLVDWRGKQIATGIFKQPTDKPIMLGKEDVEGDQVIDRKYHGGIDKACYLYSADHYPYWKEMYPDLDWTFGMFGENLTLEGLDEKKLYIGDIFQLGSAKIQISEPRQPCFKLGIRFETQSVLKKFINSSFCGSYVRVIERGTVQVGDEMKLIQPDSNQISIAEVYRLEYSNDISDVSKIKEIIQLDIMSNDIITHLKKRLKILEA